MNVQKKASLRTMPAMFAAVAVCAVAAMAIAFAGFAAQPAYAKDSYAAQVTYPEAGKAPTKHITVDEAFVKAKSHDGATVQLLGPATMTQAVSLSSGTLTVDLHKHELAVAKNLKGFVFQVKSGAKLKFVDTVHTSSCVDEGEAIVNGTFSSSDRGICLTGTGKLVISSGKYSVKNEFIDADDSSSVSISTANCSSGTSSIWLVGKAKATLSNSRFDTFERGTASKSVTITASHCTIKEMKCPEGSTTIKSGTIDVLSSPKLATSSVTVNGGTINDVTAGSSAKTTINGGTIGGMVVTHNAQCYINGGTFKGYATKSAPGKKKISFLVQAFHGILKIKGGTFYSTDPMNAFLALNDDLTATSSTKPVGKMLAVGYALYKVSDSGAKTKITHLYKFGKSSAATTYGRDGSFGLDKPNGVAAGKYVVEKCSNHRMQKTKCGACRTDLVGKKTTVGTSTTKASYKILGATSASYTKCKVSGGYAPVVPATIKIYGKELKVTKVAKEAFREKSVKKVTVGKNVTGIGTRAFYKCTKLRTIILKTEKLTSSKVGTDAFKRTYAYVNVKCGDKLGAYKKWLYKKGLSTDAHLTRS